MPRLPVSTDYDDCCLCPGGTDLVGDPIAYLPVAKTLYCTWGGWTGELIKYGNPDLDGVCVPGANTYRPYWAGIASVDCDRVDYADPYTGECIDSGSGSVRVLVLMDCNGVRAQCWTCDRCGYPTNAGDCISEYGCILSVGWTRAERIAFCSAEPWAFSATWSPDMRCLCQWNPTLLAVPDGSTGMHGGNLTISE